MIYFIMYCYIYPKVRQQNGFECRTLVLDERDLRIPRRQRDTVLAWIEKREMPATKNRQAWKFKISEVDAWMKSGVAAEK